MKFAFTCELCRRDMQRSDKVDLNMYKADDDRCSSFFEEVEVMCLPCANKIVTKIETLRKRGASRLYQESL